LKNRLISFKYTDEIKKDLTISLYRADIDIDPSEYLKYTLLFSLLLGLVSTFFFLQIDPTLDILSLAVVFFISFLFMFLVIKRIPSFLAKARAAQIESDLPIAIRSIGIQLNMKVPFETAIENIAKSDYRCSGEFKKAINMIDSGTPIPDALRQIAERVDSQIVKKLMVQLIHVYLEGLDGTELKHSADELIHSQRFKFKEFSAKLNFLSLMFIAVSSIVPTMYLAYIIVASVYLETPTSPSDVWFMFLFLFPIIDLILILYIKMVTPAVLTNISDRFLSKKEQAMLKDEIHNLGIKLSLKDFFIYIFAFSLLISIILYFYFGIYGFAALALPAVIYFILLWMVERKANEIEQYLPDALLYAATLEYGIPMEKIIDNIANSGYHSLSNEFKKAERQIKVGISLTHSLMNMRDRNSSMLLDRVISLLIQCYKTGKDVHQAIKETAEDIFELNMLKKEQASSLALQKYTILIGGCIFVPIILSVILNIVSGIQPPTNDENLIQLRNDLITQSYSAVQSYIVIFVLLSSIFVAFQEGRLRTFIGYFIIFLPIALFLFNIAKEVIRIT
jgi:flagellar protein FlaJ